MAIASALNMYDNVLVPHLRDGAPLVDAGADDNKHVSYLSALVIFQPWNRLPAQVTSPSRSVEQELVVTVLSM